MYPFKSYCLICIDTVFSYLQQAHVNIILVKFDEQQSGNLSLQNQNVELWEEISERTFFRDISINRL